MTNTSVTASIIDRTAGIDASMPVACIFCLGKSVRHQ